MLINRKKSAVIIQGVVNPALFDFLKKRRERKIVILEGRPSLKAVKHGSEELLKRKLSPIVIADNTAGFLFYKGLVKEVWIAYQMNVKQGALCDIGALILGVLAKKHCIAVNLYPSVKSYSMVGEEDDTLCFQGVRIAPSGVKAYVPLMEWLPNKYITKIYESNPTH